MDPTNVSLPIKICQPRCFVISPAVNRGKALVQAGARSEGVFGHLAKAFKKHEVRVTLSERWLIPFWHVRCKSHFHYDRFSSYTISASDSDVIEIVLEGPDGDRLVAPVNQKAKTTQVTLHGTERCVTDREVSEFIDAYEPRDSGSIGSKVASYFQDEQKHLAQYLAHPNRPVTNFPSFYQTRTLDGNPIFTDSEGENLLVVMPDRDANRVVTSVMKKVMVSIEPVAIRDWLLTVDTVDLYFRPQYVFQFERLDKMGKVSETKVERLDGLTGKWSMVETRQVRQSTVPWDKILILTVDASAVVIQELGGPWLKVAGGLLQVGTKHVPGIIEEMKDSNKPH